MDIGFIGLGSMGSGMAANLLNAGHQVTVYNRSPGKAEALVAQGAIAARTIAEASSGAVVFTMLADDRAVEDVAFGENGIVTSLAPGRHPCLVEHHQRRAVGAAGGRARPSGSAVYRGAGLR